MPRLTYADEHEMINRYAILTECLSGAKAQDPISMRGTVCRACYDLVLTVRRRVRRAEHALELAEKSLSMQRTSRPNAQSRAAVAAAERKVNLAKARLDSAQEFDRAISAGSRVQHKTKDHAIAGRQKYKDVCSRCGSDWEGVDVPVFKGEFDSSRIVGGTAEWLDRTVDEYSHLTPILDRSRRPKSWSKRHWCFARLATLSRHHGDVGTISVIVEQGQLIAPEYGDLWEYEKVRYWIRRFESKIRERGLRQRLIRKHA